jgi:hypothetical protein
MHVLPPRHRVHPPQVGLGSRMLPRRYSALQPHYQCAS